MLVRALMQHRNSYGATYIKEVGDLYEVPDDEYLALVYAGLVEATGPVNIPPSIEAPVLRTEQITPSDETIFVTPTRGIYIGYGGDLVIRNTDGVDLTFTFTTNGTVLPIVAKMVKATGTTAQNIIGMF